MIRRIFGTFLLAAALLGIGISIAGVRVGHDLIDSVISGLDETLRLTSDSLDTVVDTLTLARTTVTDVNTAVNTATTTATDLATTIDDTQPLLNEVTQVATQDTPESLEAIQAAVPALEQAADTIDDTLRTMSQFEIDETILGFRLYYDLGVDYNPDTPFDEAVTEIGTSLEGMPESLRSLETHLTTTSENLTTISADIDQLVTDVEAVNERIAETDPLLAEYIRIFTETNDNTRLFRQQLDEKGRDIKHMVTIFFAWVCLMQLPALYLGIELLSGQYEPSQYVSRQEFDALVAATAVTEVEESDDERG